MPLNDWSACNCLELSWKGTRDWYRQREKFELPLLVVVDKHDRLDRSRTCRIGQFKKVVCTYSKVTRGRIEDFYNLTSFICVACAECIPISKQIVLASRTLFQYQERIPACYKTFDSDKLWLFQHHVLLTRWYSVVINWFHNFIHIEPISGLNLVFQNATVTINLKHYH